MATDQEIANGVAALLRQYDPNAVPSLSVNSLVKQLESKLGLDLSDRAPFIHDLLRRFHPKLHFSLPHSLQLHNSSPQIPPNPFPSPPLHHSERALQCPPPQQHTLPSLPVATPRPPPQQQQQPQSGVPVASVPESPKESESPNERLASVPELSKGSVQGGGKRKGGPGGLNKLCGVSPQLQTIVGAPTMPRTEIVKQLWAYLRKHNCQDPSNKRKIICDDALRLVFETDSTDMFKMNKLLAKHIIPLEPKKQLVPDAKRLKVTESESMIPFSEPSPLPVIISDVLAKFFGTGEKEMHQSEAVGRVWDYIKVNHLEFQDPTINGTMIRSDSKLRALFECENFPALRVPEMLMRHFFKIS